MIYNKKAKKLGFIISALWPRGDGHNTDIINPMCFYLTALLHPSFVMNSNHIKTLWKSCLFP